MPPLLSSLCLMHLPLHCATHSLQPVTKTVAWHHSCVTKYCYRRLQETGDCFRKDFLWRRYNRHCPEIYTQHVTSSPLQIKTHFLCESSLLSDFFSFNRSWSVMTCCPQLPTRKVLRFSTESPGLPAATWQRTDGKWQEILIKRWTWSCQVIITIILTHLLKYSTATELLFKHFYKFHICTKIPRRTVCNSRLLWSQHTYQETFSQDNLH